MLRKIFANPLTIYRVFAVIGFFSIPLFRLAFPEGVYDPMALRGALSLTFAGVFAMTYGPEKLRKRVPLTVTVVLFLVNCWALYLLFENHYSIHYLISYIVLIFCCFLLMPSRVSVAGLFVFNLLATGTMAFFVEEPLISPLFVFFHSLVVFGVGAVAVQGRLLHMEHMLKGVEEKNFIQNAAIGASRDGILLVDLEGNFIRANETFFKFWGIAPKLLKNSNAEQVKDISLSRVVDSERYAQMLEKPEREGSETAVEEFELLDGRVLEISFLVVRMGTKPVGRMWFFRDVTIQKRAAEELRASEKRLRHRNGRLTELAGHPSLLGGDLDEAFELVTQTLGDLLGVDTCSLWFFDYEKRKMTCQKHYLVKEKKFESGQEVPFAKYESYFREVLENRLFAVQDTEDHPIAFEFREGRHTGVAAALCHAQIRAGDNIIGLLTIEQKDSRKWSIEDQTFITSMADLIAISIEVNRRKQISEQLERSFAVLKATFDLSETGILVVDNDNGVIDFNDLYLKTWNMERDFLLRENYETKLQFCLNQVRDARDIEEGARMVNMRPGSEYAGIIEFKDGRVVERYSKGLRVQGEIMGRVWFYLDITDRKKKENELISRNFELDSFVYRASHDLKAPLNSIMGLINIILEEKELDSVLQYVAMMDKSVKKLEEFIKQLTQFSQDARLQVVRKPIVFEEMVNEIWEDLRYMDNAERVELQSEIQQKGEFFSDPVRLAIVLNNIISNAIKYQDLKKERGLLRVDIRSNEDHAVLRFEDNGLGIDSEHLQKVFDLFFRASVQATGSGLGLYITHNAVEKLGGKIQVDSEKGCGTTFEIRLPNRLHEEEAVSEPLRENS